MLYLPLTQVYPSGVVDRRQSSGHAMPSSHGLSTEALKEDIKNMISVSYFSKHLTIFLTA